jgi:hypothetical protein
VSEWERKGKYYETCGTHNVAAVLGWSPAEPGSKWHFEAWDVRRRPHEWLAVFDTAAEARAFCEWHAAQPRQEAA